PFLNPGKDRPETLFRTDGPGSIEYLRSADGPYGDSGFVPWSRWMAKLEEDGPELAYQPYRLKVSADASVPSGWRSQTFKNVYYYLHHLRRGLDDAESSLCSDLRDDLYDHYDPSMSWHLAMDRDAKAEGFLVDEMERMRKKQDALWKLYQDFTLSESASHRAALTERIDAALREGYAAGCIPMDPHQPTVCDWAPSLLVDGVMSRIHSYRGVDEAECVAELGSEPFTNADLHAKFVELAPHPDYDPTAYSYVTDRRADALSRVFTDNSQSMHSYFRKMKGSHDKPPGSPGVSTLQKGYRELIADVFDLTELQDVLTDRFEERKRVDGEFFSAEFEASGQSTANLDSKNVCKPTPFNTAEGAVRMSIGDVKFDVMEFVANQAPDELFFDVKVDNDLVYLTDGGYQHCHAATAELGWQFFGDNSQMKLVELPFGEVVIGGTSSGDVSASIKARYCNTHHGTPDLPASAQIPQGDVPCVSQETSKSELELAVQGTIDGSAYLALKVIEVLKFGVKGDMTVARLKLPIKWSTETTTFNEDYAPKTKKKHRTSLKLDLLAGKLSVYLAFDAKVFKVTVFDLVLVDWHGLRLEKPLIDSEGNYDLCLSTEIGLIGAGAIGWENNADSCPCRLRSADCHDQEEA
ncbi:MAG: hypothetical protein AAGA54_33860, partial [Myxococcota bacterium]